MIKDAWKLWIFNEKKRKLGNILVKVIVSELKVQFVLKLRSIWTYFKEKTNIKRYNFYNLDKWTKNKFIWKIEIANELVFRSLWT